MRVRMRPICDCCGNPTDPGERRTRCRMRDCEHMFGLCCRGDLNPPVCTCCYREQTSYGTSRPRNYHDNGVTDFGYEDSRLDRTENRAAFYTRENGTEK